MKILAFCPKYTFGSNMYILISSSEAAVIDPSIPFDEVSTIFEDQNIRFKYIFITHAHFDHILAIESWKENTDACVVVGVNEAPSLSDPYFNGYLIFAGENNGYFGEYRTLIDGESLWLADEKITVVNTPGHTQGGISFLIDDNIFVGDTIFAGNSYGRVDLPGGDIGALKSSIDRIKALDPQITVHPGHGNKFRISEIKTYFI